jgi:glycine/D-amino acid oxidase-like deaminating enzyme
VEIVGGGITGCSCALTLAEAGKRVRLHEARTIASGASGRNGGFALRGGAMAYDSAIEWLGHDAAAEYWRLTESYVDRMAELAANAFRRTGSLRLAGDDERDELRAEYEALRDDGFAVEWRPELPDPLRDSFPGALFHPDDAVLRRPEWRSGSTTGSRPSTRWRPRRWSSPPTGIPAACSASSRG